MNVVKKAYSEVSSFDALVDAILSAPLYRLNQECSLRPGMPVEPMLAKPTKSIQEVLKRLNGKRFTCEYKYDGERAQIHMNPDGVTKVCISCDTSSILDFDIMKMQCMLTISLRGPDFLLSSCLGVLSIAARYI